MVKKIQKNQKSINLSLRIDKEVYETLAEQAKDQGISLNSLLNSITKRHLTWERFADEIGFVPITKRTLKKIFRNLDENTIDQLADQVGGIVPRELVYLTFGTTDIENLLKVIEINATRFGKVNHSINGSTHRINISHGICENFSKFLSATHQVFANDFGLQYTAIHVDKNMFCFEIESPSKVLP